MSNMKALTVDDLKKTLNELSALGFGDMRILLGKDTPLLKDSIGIYYLQNELLIRNRYYHEQLVDALSKLKDSIDKGICDYITDCNNAGINIKEEEEC